MASIVKPSQLLPGDSPQHRVDHHGQPIDEPNGYLAHGPVLHTEGRVLRRIVFTDGTEIGPFAPTVRVQLANR
jgi:hypothetical protein